MENGLARDITVAGAKIQYDAQCKRVLSEKVILAWILKTVAGEFADLTIRQIEQCIEGNPEISTVQVMPGASGQAKPVPGKIAGLRTEDKIPDEGAVYYDIRFFALVPKKGERVKIIINLEAQKTFYPGYEIVTRGIFYCGRMLSAQLGTEFEAPDYDGLKKVYSIWICMNAPKYIGNAISRYSLTKQDVVSGIPDKTEAYDKISVVQICLNEKASKSHKLFDMLNLLLSPRVRAEVKKKKLAEEFDIGTDNQLGKEINQMCNLSDLVEEKGIEQGIERGKEYKVTELVEKKLKRGQTVEEIADALEESVETIQRIIEGIK